MTSTKKILTFFTNSGAPATGLTPTIRIRDLSDNSLVVTNDSMDEVGDGYYSYDFESYDINKEYSIRADGGGSLSASDRYTYGANENYVGDIWDAQYGDHQIVGSLSREVGASGTVHLGGGNNGVGRSLTMEEAKTLARMVWEVILSNDKKAGDVLVSRSDFNAIKDKVMLAEKIEIPPLPEIPRYEAQFALLTKTINDLVNKKLPDIRVDIPAQLTADLNNVNNVISQFKPAIDSSTKEFSDLAKVFNAQSAELLAGFSDLNKKLGTMEVELSETNLDLSQAGELARAMDTLRESVSVLLTLANKISDNSAQMKLLKQSMMNVTNMKYALLNRSLKK